MVLQKGKYNCITDVGDVKVGHVTLYEKIDDHDTICTGVTAILPHSGNLFKKKTHAANAVINGFGKTTGLVQLDELGLLESPIMLTNTLSVGSVMQGTLQYMLEENEDIGVSTGTINLVVGECNDGYLNSIRLQAVKPEHAIQAIKKASTEPVQEGAVGAGKGMACFEYKGGIGTASRIISAGKENYTVGCLVLSNFGKREQALFANWNKASLDTPDGSIMIIIATDAPLYDRQLKRLASRSTVGLGRTGSTIDHGSGDIAIAFSTAATFEHNSDHTIGSISFIRDDHPAMGQLFQGVIEATEEAIMNSLKHAETTVGRRGRMLKKAPL
ncbi:DmpA family aminopeptidase [Oceanobacillus profundus]|uniref:DmpA family aminopeptidase n=1 Tax=Oceanobacillus profundus TaxID=372463 RepID=UPI0036427B12